VPVLVDFGFAEKYNLEEETAFRSNLTYGTPEVSFFLLLVYMH
jgi:serine/threonine-protein kinase GIN4